MTLCPPSRPPVPSLSLMALPGSRWDLALDRRCLRCDRALVPFLVERLGDPAEAIPLWSWACDSYFRIWRLRGQDLMAP